MSYVLGGFFYHNVLWFFFLGGGVITKDEEFLFDKSYTVVEVRVRKKLQVRLIARSDCPAPVSMYLFSSEYGLI